MKDKKIIVGATGASGLPLLIKCLELIKRAEGYASVLLMSKSAKLTLEYETGTKAEAVREMADETYDIEDISAGPASGSYSCLGMIIVPCSMKTLAGIHSGYADNLMLRAADVQIKEKRPLVLAVREMPLSPIHLRNMQELSIIPDVHIMPPMMTFYQKPETIDEMMFNVCARLLVPLGIKAEGMIQWDGL